MQFPLVVGSNLAARWGRLALHPQRTIMQAANGLGNSPSQLPTPPNDGVAADEHY
jgi:hypothetical protein